MTYKQIKYYRAEWAKARAALMQSFGRSATQAEEERFNIHEAVTGQRGSSTALTNKELTQVLIYFWTWANADDELHITRDRQDAIIARYCCRMIYGAIKEIDPTENIEPHRVNAYVDGIFRRLNAKKLTPQGEPYEPDFAPGDLWHKVIMAVSYRYDQVFRRVAGIETGRKGDRFWPTNHAKNLATLKRSGHAKLSLGGNRHAPRQSKPATSGPLAAQTPLPETCEISQTADSPEPAYAGPTHNEDPF